MAYPPDTQSSYNTEVEYTCPHCYEEWEAEASVDLGQCALINDMDKYCPECNTEGK